MGLPLPLLAVLALAASRCRADSQCSDGGAEPEVHDVESDDDGAFAQLRTARAFPAMTMPPWPGSAPSGSSACTAAVGGVCFSGSMCCGDMGPGDTVASSCKCCPNGCPGSDSTDDATTTSPPLDDSVDGATTTSPPLDPFSAGAGECTAPGAIDPQDMINGGAAKLKKAGKCGADGCTCSTGLISVGGCRTCSAMR
ncbi:unnamed protein product [Prorocentrum cordatum]|uniref:Uncharacterized protein n=1 Tax=Prorocentrum cordatum TaxID=2364126 RepID=A0ABN9VS10_9DINO|nr:unnamed protein product [Polarella glacialis]